MLDIYVPLLVFTAIIFLALIVILNNILYKPMLAFMDKREHCVSADEDIINKNIADIENFQKEAEKIISDAKKIASKNMQETIQDAKDKILVEVTKKKKELENDFDKFLDNLKEQKNELCLALSNDIPSIKESLNKKFSEI